MQKTRFRVVIFNQWRYHTSPSLEETTKNQQTNNNNNNNDHDHDNHNDNDNETWIQVIFEFTLILERMMHILWV